MPSPFPSLRAQHSLSPLYIPILLCIASLVLRTIHSLQDPPNPNERCPGHADKGPCNRNLYKWYYDAERKQCRIFLWGGCAGNDKNRFDTEVQCMRQCTLRPKSDIENKTNPVPNKKRGPQLTFQETGHQNTFMFAQSNTFIQIDGDIIQTFQLRLCRQISFKFRTRLPHGLLVYHNVKVPAGVSLQPYALYVIVQQGQLKVVHVYGKHSTALTVGWGLNRDEWHSVTVRIDVHGARLMATVDNLKDETYLKGLDKEANYGVSANVTSVILIGGLSSEERLHGVKYIIESFVGCIEDVVLSSGKSASDLDLLPITPLIATKHENVQEGCVNKCDTLENLCFQGSRCINHYNGLTCDCFGTPYEGEYCDIFTATVLTLRGSAYVSYRVYDWKDRVHSAMNRFSMVFRTQFDDSALFYASGGEHEIDHHVAASIVNNSVYIEVNFGGTGDGTVLSAVLGQNADLKEWNNLTIFHENRLLHLVLNEERVVLNVSGNRLLYIDPEIYIGGGSELTKKIGLKSSNNFAGCLKYVFYNDISIIYELQKMNPKVHYIGILRPEFYEADVSVIPMTFPFLASHIWWPNNKTDILSLDLDFKSGTNLSVLASSETQTGLYWEVRVVNDEVRFELADSVRNVTQLISVKKIPGIWHTMTLKYGNDEVFLSVDSKYKKENIGELKFAIGDRIKIGSGSRSNAGLVGCIRDIELNGEKLEPRRVLQMERVFEVTLDDCRFVDPCKRPNTCEHGGLCSVKEDKLTCNCDNTGYTGMNCHFTKYRKTCEELALLGYTKPDVYLIDIDGNGRFPPAHVRCEFQSLEDSTKTIVEHNLPSQMDVRSPSEADFSFSIKYREFTADMLQELVSHSLNCSQYIRYDCLKAPLDLHSNTWFISSANETVDYIGDVKRGTCPCSVDKQCERNTTWCNCDYVNATGDKWMADNGSYTKVSSLGITEMFFLQQADLSEEALGRITLGPLECVETNTQKYVVTFTTSQSFIEVPGWRKGDLAFSFRTTGRKAILLYQPPIRPNYPSFMVALTSDFQLTFNFTLNTGVSREIMIVSARSLNAGEWHKIWIDYNRYHVRFMINEDQAMVNLNPEEEFGPFEGSMFIGGAPDSNQQKSSVTQGLIGCFRGLVVNEEILDIYSYMSVHLSEIIKDCKPSCVPNPCKNGAQCRELWSTFECICPNPWAYNGTTCEYNINTKGITFTTPASYIRRNYLGTQNSEEKIILKRLFSSSPILFNIRTYDQDAFILYANDHLNNFAHIFMQDGHTLVYQFNHGRYIHNISVQCSQLNSSESVQVAIVRESGLGPAGNISITTLHVNNDNRSVYLGVKLLDEYWSKPWRNTEKEILAPPRPPAPPTDYFQINVGGFDAEALLKVNDTPKHLNGYVGCFRGFQIGDTLIDLPAKVQSFDGGVLPICNMSCDALPCKHGGLCIEHFAQAAIGGHSCDCEHTSYYGEHCADDKGAEFSGESNLWREFPLGGGSVRRIKVQMAFSSMDVRKTDSVLMLLQSENDRSYYFLIRITHEGHLVVEEDREELGLYSATVYSKTFVNGARHSIYYKRQCVLVNTTVTAGATTTQPTLVPLGNGGGINGVGLPGPSEVEDTLLMEEMMVDSEVLVNAGLRIGGVIGLNDSLLLGCIGENVVIEELLLVDGEKVEMVPINRVQYKQVPQEGTGNEVQIGGHRTSSDPRFMTYKWYSGCLSNIFIEINDHSMKPLEEYMLFTRTGLEKVNVSNPQGVRSAQCSAQFDTQHKTHNGPPNLNITQGKDKTWVQDAPQRIPYTPPYTISAVVEDDREEIAVIVLSSLFIIVIICVMYEVYRSDKAYRKRKERMTDVNIMWSKEHAAKIQEPTNTLDPGDALKSLQNGKSVKLSNGNISINGNNIPEIELISVTDMDNIQKPEKRITFKETMANVVEENNLDKPLEKGELLSPMLEEDEENLDDDSNDSDNKDNEDSDDTEATEELIPTINGCSIHDEVDVLKLSSDRSAQILRNMGKNPYKQVFLAPSQRKFGNPISYLGGPTLPTRNRSSVESVLSLD